MAQREFKELFCERFRCPASEFEDAAFKAILYWHAKPVAPFIRKFNPDSFGEDFKFLGYLAAMTDLREAKANAADFKEANRAKPNFWRTGLRIRVSGMKAIKLAQELFSQELRVSSRPA